jgi:sarcosine oxidase gamma subunit
MDLTEALTNCDTALSAAQSEMQALTERIARLRDEKRGLELAIARLNGHATPAKSNGWEAMSRPEAVLRLLQQHDSPMSPAEITRQLAEVGRPDDPRFVSAALSALRARRQVERVGPGEWVVLKDRTQDSLLQQEEASSG